MNTTQREALILGGILHDIGKFWQRADREINYEKSDYLMKNTKAIIADICPKRQPADRVSHVHSAWTYQFFVSYEDQVKGLRGSGPDSAIHLASKHHRPDTTLQEIIRLADWLSSAQDRSKETEDEKEENQRRFLFRKRRLHPVFESIFRKEVENRKYRFPLQPLLLTKEAIFAREFPGEETDLYQEYRSLWKCFESELKQLPSESIHVFIETLVALLQKYTWCVPGSTGDFPDISLYDHLKTTAAIAVCLYDYFTETHPDWVQPGNQRQRGQVVQWHRDNDLPFARLVCGDISGIQSFIYQISSKKAAVSLKGRSFYLQLLSELVTRHFTRVFHLPVTNVIYSSGGSVYLLIPNTADFDQKIEKARKQINRALLRQFEGELYLGLGSTTLTNKDLLNSSLDSGTMLESKWREAIEAANQDKHKRFFYEVTKAEHFFAPYGEGAELEQCQACGKDTITEDLIILSDREDENPIQVCGCCNQFIEIGQKLKRLDWIVEVHGDAPSCHSVNPVPDTQIRYILSETNHLSHVLEACHGADFIKLIRVNNTEFLPPDTTTLRGGTRAYGFRFYGGNTAPVDDGDVPLTFSDLAGDNEFKRLGILRMDLDNLGFIFQQGLLRESPNGAKITDHTARYSISRLSTLSSLLDLFFSGYLNTLRQNKYVQNTQIVYSGGDDLFIVGQWNASLNFALDIYREFRAFTGYHPLITLSGGVALTPGKYPIHRAAELAGEAEKQAKNIDDHKNAFSFLGKAMKWDDFLELEQLKMGIEAINGNLDNQALSSRLRQIYGIYFKEKQQMKLTKLSPEDREEIINYNKWRWRMVYSLSRLAKQEKKVERELNKLESRLTSRLPSGKSVIDYLDIPVRWAEFNYRSQNKKEGNAYESNI